MEDHCGWDGDGGATASACYRDTVLTDTVLVHVRKRTRKLCSPMGDER